MGRLLDLVYPRRCSVCGALLPFGQTVCACTRRVVRRVGLPFCEHCGMETAHCVCGEQNGHPLRHLTAPFLYTDQIRYQLRALKFQNERRLAKPFGRRMALRFAEAFPTAKVDVVTFVPMTAAAQKRRGFNQSALLAKYAAQALDLPLLETLQKTQETEHQSLLSAAERLQNLSGKIRCQNAEAVRGRTILLCDDIKTTGATLWECEQALLAAGAKDVFCLCCALSDYGDVNAVFAADETVLDKSGGNQ